MDKQIILTGREASLVMQALIDLRATKLRLTKSDDPGIQRIGRSVANELLVVMDKIQNAELA